MIRITDFKNYNDFKDFIINYLKQEDLLEIFECNLKDYNYYHNNLNSYLCYIYVFSIKLNDFFIESFDWGSSHEGVRFWRKVNEKYRQYLENNLTLLDCWDD